MYAKKFVLQLVSQAFSHIPSGHGRVTEMAPNIIRFKTWIAEPSATVNETKLGQIVRVVSVVKWGVICSGMQESDCKLELFCQF